MNSEDMFDCWIEPEEPYDALADNYVDDFEFGYEENELPKSMRRQRRYVPSAVLLDRIPPQNLDAEKAILGIYLTHPKKRNETPEGFVSEMFYSDANRKVFETMSDLEHLDGILLAEELRKQGDLESVGGIDYLAELHKSGLAVNPEHLQDYIKILRDKSFRQDLIHCLTEKLRNAYELSEDIKEIVESLSKEVLDISKRL